MSNTTLTIDQLCLSPLNVRTYSPDAEDTVGLQASILAEGLINPISVHPLKGNKTKWGAVAGGRRYRAIKALIGNGDLPTDYAVKVQILDTLSDAELIEHSITENLIRRDLRDYEICAGVARAASRGHSVDQIAKGIGQANVTNVGRWLRLGRLAPTIFDAFRTGAISHEQASAFAATEDQDLQRVTFERLAPISTHLPTPAEIRRAMNVGDAKAKRDLAFVGADAYRAAGGRFELDLFADAAEERGRVVDDGKLQQLVDARIAIVRDEVRVTTSRPDLRFLTEQPKDQWGSVDHQLIVKAKQLSPGKLELPSEDVVAHIAIDASGAPIVSYWWESRKAKFGSERKAAAADTATLTTPAPPVQPSPFDGHHRIEAAGKTDDGASQDSLFALSAVRKTIERAALLDDALTGGSVGLDYLVWAQARALLVRTGYGDPRLGMWVMTERDDAGASAEAYALARDLVTATEASRICARDVLIVTERDFFTDRDLGAAFQAFRDATDDMKRLTAAVVAGFALKRSLAGTDRHCEMHDVVGRAVGLGEDATVRLYWTPTGDMLDMFPKAQRLAIAEPFVDRATILTWAKLKSSELTTGVLSAVTRAGSKGASWVHPLLRFGHAVPADQPIQGTKLEEVA